MQEDPGSEQGGTWTHDAGCNALQIKSPAPDAELLACLPELLRLNFLSDAIARITISRGPGGLADEDGLPVGIQLLAPAREDASTRPTARGRSPASRRPEWG